MKTAANCATERIEILAEIQRVFADARMPAPTEISAGNITQGQEYAYSQGFFAGRRWQDIDNANLLHEYPSGVSAAVTFLSDQGFVYYLPLFMSCVLVNFSESGDLLESLLPELERTKLPGRDQQFLDRVSLLNSQQKQCIAHFLNFLATCHANDLPEEIYGKIAPNVLLSCFWADFQVAQRD